jgi:two-component system, OmpR family, sensor histidine kinase KdpD
MTPDPGDSRAADGDPRGELAEIASMAAHELRNPIASIRGLAATGVQMYERLGDDERLEFFRLIDEEARRLSVVAESVSTALKIAARTLTYDARPAAVGPLVRGALDAAPTGERAVSLEADDALTARVDGQRLADALARIIDNAARFSPSDAPIDVRVLREADHVVVEVADRGPGIGPEHRDEVFRPFTRHRPAGYEEAAGSGLGLSIARAHVLALGGRIEVDGRPGGGTMLRVLLPLEGEAP